jgi:hypothetical protein
VPITPEIANENVASLAWHMQIHNDQVRELRRRSVERAGDTEGRADGVPLIGERLGDEIDYWLIVVHNQDITCIAHRLSFGAVAIGMR